MGTREKTGWDKAFGSIARSFTLLTCVLALSAMCACSSGSSTNGGKVNGDDAPTQTDYYESPYAKANSADDSYDQDYWDTKFQEGDYETRLTDWEIVEWNLRRWLESGQQQEECRQAIIEWSTEVISYDWSKVPDQYKSVHDTWVQRAYDLRSQVQ